MLADRQTIATCLLPTDPHTSAVMIVYLAHGGNIFVVWTLMVCAAFWMCSPAIYNPNPTPAV